METNRKKLKTGIAIKIIFSLILMFIAITHIGALILFIIACFPISLYLFILLLIPVSFVFYIKKDEIMEDIKEKKEEKEKQRQKIIDEEKRTTDASIKTIRYANVPKKLTHEQYEKYRKFYNDVKDYINKTYNLSIYKVPFLTLEENFTFIFLNKECVEISVWGKGKIITLYVKDSDNGPVIENEYLLEDYKVSDEEITQIQKNLKTKKHTSNKVKRLRKQRKLANTTDVVIKKGKEYQPPNYDFIAKEWIIANMKLLNIMATDDSLKNMKKKNVLIPEDKLPSDKNTWKVIGVKLKADDEIDSFNVEQKGLRIFF